MNAPTTEQTSVENHVTMTLRKRGVGNKYQMSYTLRTGERRDFTGPVGECYAWAKAEAGRFGLAYQIR